ncbi:MAG: SAM-dependent methyltransferase [Saprospiraceae bacterium]
MRKFSTEEITNYYDHTEVHYRQFWKLEESMGLHYGVWGENTRTLAESILNTNAQLARMGGIGPEDVVLDAGCGVGGSAIYLAKKTSCTVTGITLSERQVKAATRFAQKNDVQGKVQFRRMDYTATDFPDNHFDVVWAIESMQTATGKSLFLREMKRVLKPGGRLLVADVFKVGTWKMENTPVMQDMLHGWAMSDILSIPVFTDLSEKHTFALTENRNVTEAISPSIRRIRWAALAGMVGTKWYNLFHRATHFSRVHYKTGLAQYRAWKKGLWAYHLLSMNNEQ